MRRIVGNLSVAGQRKTTMVVGAVLTGIGLLLAIAFFATSPGRGSASLEPRGVESIAASD